MKKSFLFLLLPIFSFSIFLSEAKAEEKEETTWGDVGRATLRGGVKGAIGGPYKSAAGAIIDGGKELYKKQSEDGQRDLEGGTFYRSYKAGCTQEGLQPDQPGYLSDEEKKKVQQQLKRKDLR